MESDLPASFSPVQWVGWVLQVKLDMVFTAACTHGVHWRVLHSTAQHGTGTAQHSRQGKQKPTIVSWWGLSGNGALLAQSVLQL
jgi:hypothetical protein